MIRLVDRENHDRYPYLVDRLFRFRHDIFVKERGWHDFDRAGIYETDQYDNEDAVHFVAVDEVENVIGCCRLTPSLAPNLTHDRFTFLVEGAVPRRSDLFDLTRFAVARGSRGTQTYPELLAGVQEYCIEQGVIGATSIVRTFRIPLLQAAGMNITPLGLPQNVQDENLTAVIFNVSEEILAAARRNAKIRGQVIYRDPPKIEQMTA